MGDSCCRGTGTQWVIQHINLLQFLLYRNYFFDIFHSTIDRFLDLYEFAFQLITMSLVTICFELYTQKNFLLMLLHQRCLFKILHQTIAYSQQSWNCCLLLLWLHERFECCCFLEFRVFIFFTTTATAILTTTTDTAVDIFALSRTWRVSSRDLG